MAISKKIMDGRAAVEAYRAAHGGLYVGKSMLTASVAKSVIDAHPPIIDTLTKAIIALGFKSLDAFFAASKAADLADGIKYAERWK